jgi:hypothetical protein
MDNSIIKDFVHKHSSYRLYRNNTATCELLYYFCVKILSNNQKIKKVVLMIRISQIN